MKYSHYFASGFFIGLLLTSTATFALPFNIVPQSPLPTTVNVGQTASAFYTVTNNTKINRFNNFVKWLPPNVTQFINTSNTSLCGSTFDLAIGKSCTLRLTVSGPVNRNDPNPHHHLFVCFPGGKTCAGPTPANSLNVSQNPGTGIVSTVGGLLNTKPFPLAYFSVDNGQTWTLGSLPSTANVPAGFLSASLKAVGCQNRLCASVGSYVDSLGNSRPLTYSSSNNGVSWSQAFLPSIGSIPPASDEVLLVAVSCVGAKCASVGAFHDLLGNRQPIAYSSSNNGVTWSQPTLLSIAALPAGSRGARFTTISCAGAICVAGGFYNDVANTRLPVSYRSVNNGVTWSQAILPSTAGLPAGFQEARINGVSCVDQNCAAVGEFEDVGGVTHPLSYSSSNDGASWSAVFLPSETALPPGNQGATLNGVSCAGSLCSAVGHYIDSGGANQPLSYTSNNSGVTWSEAAFPPTNFLPVGTVETDLFSVSCVGSSCTTVGFFVDAGSHTHAVTYHSFNNGVSWIAFIPSMASLPVGTTDTLLQGVGGAESGNMQT